MNGIIISCVSPVRVWVVWGQDSFLLYSFLPTSTPQHSGQQGAEAHHTLAGRVADAPQAVVCTPSLRRAQLPALPHAAHQQALSPQKRLVFGKPLLGVAPLWDFQFLILSKSFITTNSESQNLAKELLKVSLGLKIWSTELSVCSGSTTEKIIL